MQKRMDGVDALRGLSAMLVVIQHFIPFSYLGSGLWPGRPLFCLDIGRIGVAAFFLISGYVIPFSIERGAPPSAWRAFWTRRFFRLWPAYWVAIIAAVIFGAIDSQTKSVLHDLINLTMLQQFFGVPNVLGVFWTLNIELCFYFIVTGLLLCGWLHRERTQLLACVLLPLLTLAMACARGLRWHGIPVALPIALSLMFLASEIRFRRTDGRGYPWALIVYMGVIMVPVCLLGYESRAGSTDDPFRAILSYFSAFLVFMAFERLSHVPKVFVFLGTISYSVYLLHAIIIYSVMEMFPSAGLAERGVLIVGLTIAAASACYFLVEKPANHLGRVMSRRKTALA